MTNSPPTAPRVVPLQLPVIRRNLAMAYGVGGFDALLLLKVTDISPLEGSAMIALWCAVLAIPALVASMLLFHFALDEWRSSRRLLTAAMVAPFFGGVTLAMAGLCAFVWHFNHTLSWLFLMLSLLLLFYVGFLCQKLDPLNAGARAAQPSAVPGPD